MKITLDSLEICSKHCGSKCCRSTPPALTKIDFERISEKNKEDKWYNIIETNQKKAFVVAKQTDSDDCFFLSDEGLCVIYSDRPLDCTLFPLFIKIKQVSEGEYEIKWLVWYCSLTEAVGIEALKKEAKKFLISKLSENPDQIFDYQDVMHISKGYKKKHFFKEERLKILESD